MIEVKEPAWERNIIINEAVSELDADLVDYCVNAEREVYNDITAMGETKDGVFAIRENSLETILKVDTEKFIKKYCKRGRPIKKDLESGYRIMRNFHLFSKRHTIGANIKQVFITGKYFTLLDKLTSNKWYKLPRQLTFNCGCGALTIEYVIPLISGNMLICDICRREIVVVVR